MKKRNCKFKYKLIIMLLILSILLGEFAVRPMSVKAVDALTYTYWDLWYSISGAQHASMSAKEGPFDGYDVAKLKDRAKVQFDNFKTWLQRAYVPVGITVDMLVNQADEMIANAKTTGLEMSQELWDAFRQYFDDVANDKAITQSYTRDFSGFSSYVNDVLGYDANLEYTSQYDKFLNAEHIVIVRYFGDGWTQDDICIPMYNMDFIGWKYVVDGNYTYVSCSDDMDMRYEGFRIFDHKLTHYPNGCCIYANAIQNISVKILATDFARNAGTISAEYSPFIDYTVSQGCPAEVPETIPWRVYPKEETDDDTKIIPFPVEVPDEGTTEVPGEETTEKPNPDEDPDNDNDEENDPFPGIFPWFPNVPNSNPDENPDIPPWENPDSDSDPDSGLSPDPDPDPYPDPDPDPPEPEPDPDPPGKVENYLNKLKTKFPFCIPFDMVALFKNLKKTQKAPKWTFSYTFHFGDKPYTWKIVVDMADYDQYIQIFREGFFVLFLVGLFFATRKLISWQID